MKTAKRLSLVLALMLFSGCWVHTFKSNQPRGGNKHQETAWFFFGGLVPSQDFDLDAYCPHGAAEWGNQQSFADGLIELVTLGIVVPRSVTIECAGGEQ